MTDRLIDISKLETTLQAFADDRDRQQFHTPKNLAMTSSDATNIAARIQRDGDHYVINGHKWWTSGANDPRCNAKS